jgi:anaphase-promoting complex subunit 3
MHTKRTRTHARTHKHTKYGLTHSHLQVPHGAAGLYLLGRVYRLVGRAADAREQFVRALRINPLLWSAFEELCALGM